MSFSDLGINDLEDIPSGYLVSWKFLNAFFKAFQERADYIEYASRAETYEDLILDNAQIATSELATRLSSFNGKVLSCFNRTQWVKDSSWLELSSLSYERVGEPTSNRQTVSEGLGIIDLEIWEEEDLRDLLTDDGYDLVFDYSYSSSFNPLYWSSLYILLKYVMKYRKMTLSYAHEPNPPEPYLVINDRFIEVGQRFDDGEDATDTNELFEEAVARSRGGKLTFDDGNNVLWRCSVESQSKSTSFKLQGDEGTVYNNLAYVEARGLSSNPFCVVPSKMEMQVLLLRGQGTATSRVDEIDQPASPTHWEDPEFKWDFDEYLEYEIKGFKATRSRSGGWEGDTREPKEIDTEYTPNQNSYGLTYGENPKYSTSYLGNKCELSLPQYKDFRVDNDFGDLQADALGVPYFNSSLVNTVTKKRLAGSIYQLNLVLCALPQDQFEFK